MNGCCLALIALVLGPRIMIIILWLATNSFDALTGWFWPLMGFIFMPFTLLWVLAVNNWYDSHYGAFQIVILVICVLIDLGAGGSSASSSSSDG